jgi:hypothetical protein
MHRKARTIDPRRLHFEKLRLVSEVLLDKEYPLWNSCGISFLGVFTRNRLSKQLKGVDSIFIW